MSSGLPCFLLSYWLGLSHQVSRVLSQLSRCVLCCAVCCAGGGADPLQCDGCGYEQESTDLSCVLISLLALFPRLKRLEVATKVRPGLGQLFLGQICLPICSQGH
jgi:hypothetical protein